MSRFIVRLKIVLLRGVLLVCLFRREMSNRMMIIRVQMIIIMIFVGLTSSWRIHTSMATTLLKINKLHFNSNTSSLEPMIFNRKLYIAKKTNRIVSVFNRRLVKMNRSLFKIRANLRKRYRNRVKTV